MKKTYKVALSGLGVVVILAPAMYYLRRTNIAVLEPRGTVGHEQLHLIIFALLLSLIVVVPVFVLLFGFAWRYRAGNKKAKYSPELDRSNLAETVWWAVPTALIAVLSVIIWQSSHSLDPYHALDSKVKPITVQVVALDWKWLFIYPQQHIASVNFVQFPKNTPVNFEITSDTVMNSFWVPQLAGQIYAMPGMSTQLHLNADKSGSYNGSSANISGVGFAGMHFMAKASSQADFDAWVQSVQKSPNELTQSTYAVLAKSSQNNPVAYYRAPTDLYDTIVMKYMMPTSTTPATGGTKSDSAQMNMSMPGMQGMSQ